MEDENFIPEIIIKEAEEAVVDILPKKSRSSYEKEFHMFEDWMTTRNVKGINESVLLAYLSYLEKKLAPSSLWTKYSMIKTTLQLYKKINITKYGKQHF